MCPEPLEVRELLAAAPVISEFLARNDGGYRDATGDSPDWIEIFNAGDAAVDLSGYRLTETATDRAQWTFPSVTLEPGSYLVVFASGQSSGDYVDGQGNLHTNFTLQRGGDYLALVAPDGGIVSEFGTAETDFPEQMPNVSYGVAQAVSLLDKISPASYWIPTSADWEMSWTGPAFDASSSGFTFGTASLGFESRPTNRVNFTDQFQTALTEGTHAAYVRMEFDISNAAAISNLQLDLKYDNGFVAYLNGVKVAEENAPDVLGWFSTAPTGSRRDADALEAVSFDLTENVTALVDGRNVLAIHALNNPADDSDMLLVVSSLRAGVSDMQAATGSPAKVGYIPVPTPGGPNAGNEGVYAGFVADTRFSVDRGFYDEPFQVEITTETADAQIRYTTDGSAPTPTTGQLYAGPVNVSTTTNLRASAFKLDSIPSNVDTQTYIFIEDVVRQPAEIPGFPFGGRVWGGSNAYVPQDQEMDPEIVNDPAYNGVIRDSLRAVPTMSITSNINDIFGDTGWYDGEDVEHPVSVEVIYPNDPGASHQADAGIESHSHDRLKRSLRLNFRREYGDSTFRTDLFQTGPLNGQTAVDQVDRIILRGGNNRSWARIWNPDKTAYTTDEFYRATQLAMSGYGMRGNFAHLYINGVYWGLYNPTERADTYFTSAYFGGKEVDWFAVNHGGNLKGESDRYDFVRRDLARADMTDPANYAHLHEYLDVDGFIDYLTISWWMAVSDWPQNNWYGGNRNETSELGPDPFRFFAWDGEWAWGQGGQSSSTGQAHVHADFRANRRGGDFIPSLWHAARANEDFMMLLADRVYQHLFNDGALTEENAKARWTTLTDYVREAVVAESARWGDAFETLNEPTRTRDVDWVNELNRVLGLMTGNNEVFIGALRQEGFYPTVNPPTLSRHGGVVPAGFRLQLVGAGPGTIYYTTDGTDPRLPGGDVSTTAAVFSGTVELAEDTTIRARILSDGQWSPLTFASFQIASPLPLRISELNYDPHDANPVSGMAEADVDNDRFEFIELTNVGTQTIDVGGVQLVETDVKGDSQGVTFTFASQMLEAGARLVVVRDIEAFQSRYGTSVRIASGTSGQEDAQNGEYGGRLSNNGEQLTLLDSSGVVIQQFGYRVSETWPGRARGGGSSLEPINFAGGYDDSANWRASIDFGGSPGTEGSPARQSIVVNEVLSNTSTAQADSIELFNTTSQDVELSRWYISNFGEDYFRYQIESPSVIPARGYHVFTEAQLGFGLDARGDNVWLIQADASGRPLRFVDHVVFGTSDRDVSLGPGESRGDTWIALSESTFGAENSGQRFGEIVISEVYFNPTDPDGEGRLRANDFEFIELYNRTTGRVDVSDWELTGGTEFTFPSGTVVEAGGTILAVGFRPTDQNKVGPFGFVLSTDPAATLTGRYRPFLNDESGQLQLVRSGRSPVDQPEFVPRVVVDQISFGTDGPWPTSTAGAGDSLNRTRGVDDGNSPISWTARPPSPGTVAFFERLAGDANDDGLFNQLDITLVLQAAKFLTGETATWAEGDWTGDGVFDQSDLVRALVAGRYNQGTN